MQAQDLIVVTQARSAQPPAQKCDPGDEPQGRGGFDEPSQAAHAVLRPGHGFPGDAHRAEPEAATDFQQDPLHGRVKMHVVVRVHVIQRETALREGFELSRDLRPQLRPDSRAKEDAHPGTEEIVEERSVGPHQKWDLLRREDGASLHQHEMQTHAQPGQTPGAPDRVPVRLEPRPSGLRRPECRRDKRLRRPRSPAPPSRSRRRSE